MSNTFIIKLLTIPTCWIFAFWRNWNIFNYFIFHFIYLHIGWYHSDCWLWRSRPCSWEGIYIVLPLFGSKSFNSQIFFINTVLKQNEINVINIILSTSLVLMHQACTLFRSICFRFKWIEEIFHSFQQFFRKFTNIRYYRNVFYMWRLTISCFFLFLLVGITTWKHDIDSCTKRFNSIVQRRNIQTTYWYNWLVECTSMDLLSSSCEWTFFSVILYDFFANCQYKTDAIH